MDKRKEKVCILTGATGDIGPEMSEHLAKAGYTLCLIWRNKDKLLALLTQLQTNFPDQRHSAYGCDITKSEQRKNTLSQIINDHDAPDLLINNAAIIGDPKTLDEHTEQEIHDLINTNLTGTVMFTRGVIKELLEKWSPCKIITIGSTAGLYPYPNRSIYAMTKSGLKNFTESIGPEYKDKWISINYLCPWPIQWSTIDKVVEDRAKLNNVSFDEMKEKFTSIVSNDGQFLSKEDLFWAIDKITNGELDALVWEMLAWHTLWIDKIGLYDKSNPKVIAKNAKIKSIPEEQEIAYDGRRYLIKFNNKTKVLPINFLKKALTKPLKYAAILILMALSAKGVKIDQKLERGIADFNESAFNVKDYDAEIKSISRDEYGIDNREDLIQKANETQDDKILRLYVEIGQKALNNMGKYEKEGYAIKWIDLHKPFDI